MSREGEARGKTDFQLSGEPDVGLDAPRRRPTPDSVP